MHETKDMVQLFEQDLLRNKTRNCPNTGNFLIDEMSADGKNDLYLAGMVLRYSNVVWSE